MFLVVFLLAVRCLAYNVTDFGAIPSDGVNDSPAFAAALAAARVTPGPITIPAGVWIVDAGVLVLDKPGISLRGEGPGATVIQLATSGTGIKMGAPVAFEPCGGIEDLAIDAGPARSGGFAIAVDGCAKGILRNLHLGSSPLPSPGSALGHGIGFCLTSRICNRFIIAGLTAEIHGAFAAVFVNGGNDQSFSDVDIRCTERQAGSRGFLIKDNHGAWMRSVDIVFCEVGVSFEPSEGQVSEFITFDTVHSDSGTAYGWMFGGAGSIRGIQCNSCWAGGYGRPVVVRPDLPPGAGVASRGFLIGNGDGLVFNAPRVWVTGGAGMQISGTARNVQVNGGWASANSETAPGSQSGLLIATAGGVSVIGFRSGDPLMVPQYQKCGIEISPTADNFTIADVDLRGNVSSGLCNAAGTGPTRIVHDVR